MKLLDILNEQQIEMVKPKPGHDFYKLNKDVDLELQTGSTSVTNAPGVLLHPVFGKKIIAREGQYIISFFGQLFYVDMDAKFATKVPKHEDSDNMKNLRGALNPVDMAPNFNPGWKSYLPNPLEEGVSKSSIMRQIKDAEEILDSGEADGVPLDNETEMLVQQELTKLKRMLAMNETSLEEIYTQVSEAKDFGFFGNDEGKTGNSIASEAFDDYEAAVERAFQNLVNKVNTAINIGGSGGTDTEVREMMMYHFDKIQDKVTTTDLINATFRK